MPYHASLQALLLDYSTVDPLLYSWEFVTTLDFEWDARAPALLVDYMGLWSFLGPVTATHS
jgi:hypothetical protein